MQTIYVIKVWLMWIPVLKISFLNSMNTARLEDFIKCQSLHTTGLTSVPNPLECFKTFLIFLWNYTRNYIRNYVSPAAIFKKPQVHDPETLTADKKLLGAAVLLTSHLSHTPSAVEAIPSSSPPSVSLYDGACTPAVSGHEVQFAAELLIKHPALQGLLIFRIAGCRQLVRESDRSVLTFFYNEGSLGKNVDALGMKAFYVCALRDPFGAVGCLSWDLLQPLRGVESLDLMPSRALFSA